MVNGTGAGVNLQVGTKWGKGKIVKKWYRIQRKMFD